MKTAVRSVEISQCHLNLTIKNLTGRFLQVIIFFFVRIIQADRYMFPEFYLI